MTREERQGQQAMANSIPVVLPSDQTSIPVSATIPGTVDVSDRPGRLLGKAREDLLAMSWVSAKTAAPVASAVQADTLPLPAADYDFDILLVVGDISAVGKGLVVEHRDAANATTVQNLGGCSAPGNQQIVLRRYTIALNQRIRVIAGTAAGAAASMYVSAIGRRVA